MGGFLLLWETEGVGMAAPTGAATLYGTRRPLGTTLRNLTIVVQLEPLARDGRDRGRPNWRIV